MWPSQNTSLNVSCSTCTNYIHRVDGFVTRNASARRGRSEVGIHRPGPADPFVMRAASVARWWPAAAIIISTTRTERKQRQRRAPPRYFRCPWRRYGPVAPYGRPATHLFTCRTAVYRTTTKTRVPRSRERRHRPLRR